MDTTTPSSQLSSKGKPPLLTRIKDRLRDARDEYLEHIETGQTRAAAQRPPQKQTRKTHPQRHDNEPTEPHGADRNTLAALTAKNLELHQRRHTDSGNGRNEKPHHKRQHHSRSRNNHAHQEPDPRGHRKHTNPTHQKHPHGQHKPFHSQEPTDTNYLVERFVRRLEHGIEDESAQVEYLQDAAQRLLRIAADKGKRASGITPPTAEGSSKAPTNAGPTSEFVETVAGELIEQARLLEEGNASHSGYEHPAMGAPNILDFAEDRFETAGRSVYDHGERERCAETSAVRGRPSRGDRGEEGGGLSPVGRDEERGSRGEGSVSSLDSEEEE
ncbi:hypothetical protein MMC17_005481 [Xylographa soralifera]|nr:hypothetical protein [Xylographa soralifera]